MGIGWKKSNNGIKQDFEETDYEVDIVIKKIPYDCFFFATDILCACFGDECGKPR